MAVKGVCFHRGRQVLVAFAAFWARAGCERKDSVGLILGFICAAAYGEVWI